MLKKMLKWAGIILLFPALVLSITVVFRQNLTCDAPYPDIKASKDSLLIARGKYLAYEPRIARLPCFACKIRFGKHTKHTCGENNTEPMLISIKN